MAIFASTIKARLIQARTITARTIQVAADKVCRFFFTFNGDGFITTDRRWDPDAVDPSFVIEFFNDTSVTTATEFITQGVSGSGDLAVRTQIGGHIGLYLGGNAYNITTSTEMGLALWRIEYDDSANIVKTYMDDSLVNTKSAVSIGAARMPVAPFVISNNDIGIMANVKFWINGSTKETADLVLDMPINDNSNTIKDYSPLALDGVLTPGTGLWAEVCEGDQNWLDGDPWNDGDPWID